MSETPNVAPRGIKALVGKRQQKKQKFMDQELLIRKLSYAEVMEIKALAEAAEDAAKENPNDEKPGFELIKIVIRKGVEGGEDLTDKDFEDFPMDELSKMSNEIMKFSGIAGESPGK